jgi:Asp-tRNA(Asn)/Glu-tRNA(Gln) amidotransferase A subunit family amidase
MALCWSLDKVGPICRSAEDCAYVLDAIAGQDTGDEATVDVPLNIDMTSMVRGTRVGYFKDEFEGKAATDEDAATLAALEKLGCELVPVSLESAPYGGIIFFIISVEGAAVFDELTRSNLDDQLKWQDDRAWPNTFRTTRLATAVEFMQARRLRRRYMKRAAALFDGVDLVIAPRRHGAMHAMTNMTGQPALTIRQGFRKDGTPMAITLWAGLYNDAGLLCVGSALERSLDLWRKRPPIS